MSHYFELWRWKNTLSSIAIKWGGGGSGPKFSKPYFEIRVWGVGWTST